MNARTVANRQRSRRQRGATLLISLIMLIVLTLFAVSAIRTGNVGFRIVGNQQAQKLMEAAAQQAIEQVASNLGNFDAATLILPATTTAQRVCVNAAAGDLVVVLPGGTPSTCPSGTQVDVAPVRCISTKVASGGSLTQSMGVYDNVWEIIATVTDSVTGAKAVYHQGIRVRMLANNCPGLSA